MVKKRHRRRRKRKLGKKSRGLSGWKRKAVKYLVLSFLVLLVPLIGYTIYLDFVVRANFDSKRYAEPARVYARPLELYVGKNITKQALLYELDRLGYKLVEKPTRSGTYVYSDTETEIITRRFVFWDEEQPSTHLKIRFEGKYIIGMTDGKTGKAITKSVRLDPILIAKIFPSHNEDRILLRLPDEKAPAETRKAYQKLIAVLKAVEDRDFDHHFGISFKGIARAIWSNLRAGGRRQGGSTLTQQLAKNYFLKPEKTLKRKFTEMIMAILIELHYDKKEILEAYLNEIYMGQDGRRAIHGFGLASRFYFNRTVEELELHQMALLVGMVKAPSSYDPRRNPERALYRRNLVLQVLVDQKVIDQETMLAEKMKPLGVESAKSHMNQKYPAFVDLLRKQLRRDYKDEDLVKGGLQIHTTLDPVIQYYAESSLSSQIELLEKTKRLKPGSLQGALIVTNYSDGEVQAIVGGRDPKYPGFNRVLKAKRHIGSLVKPAVYLAALLSDKPDPRTGRPWTLATLLDDSEYVYRFRNGDVWAPKNYDKQYHGEVPFYLSLANSYNVTTARLGMEIGLDEVVATIKKLGFTRPVPKNPSLLLGAIEMTPLEVTQMYQTIANGGFNTQLKTIRAIMNSQGKILTSYSTKIDRVIPPGPVLQINTALQYAVSQGTGRGLARYIPKSYNIAGKTGTTDDLRDSWFAGFTRRYLGVVWLGMDKTSGKKSGNTRLTGSTGALRVWGEMMRKVNPGELKLRPQEDWGIEFHWINPQTGLRATEDCKGAVQLPFRKGTVPEEDTSCRRRGIFKWAF